MLVSLKAWILRTFSLLEALAKPRILSKKHKSTKCTGTRRLLFESLEARQLLAADLWIEDAVVYEGDNWVSVQVDASEVSNTVSVQFTTVDGTATAGLDFTGASGLLTFAPGGPLTQTIDVEILDDFMADEEFFVQLFNESGDVEVIDDWASVTGDDTGPTGIDFSGTSVDENAANGDWVGWASVYSGSYTDPLTWELADNAGGRFTIDSSTGDVTVANTSLLDYETNASHDITVKVTDANGHSYEESFAIVVNDTGPTDIDLSGTSVEENAANGDWIGTASVYSGNYTDPLTWELADNAGGRFAIDSSTGDVTVADTSLLDFETSPSHSITIRVTDDNGETYEESFAITVNDTGPTDIYLDNTSVDENAASGTTVGWASVFAGTYSDPLTWELADNAGGRFAIDSSGQLMVADGSLLDYEINTSHGITVKVTENNGDSYEEAFTITVTDTGPTDIDLSGTWVNENAANGDWIGTANVYSGSYSDPLSWQLTDNSGGRFAIDSSTGDVTVADTSLLDYETNSSHGITIRVTDDNGETYEESFAITVNDSNAAPVVNDQSFDVDENSPGSRVVGTVTASDPDGDTLSYSLSGGPFDIDSDGTITVATNADLDFETTPQYSLTVTVTDSASPQLSDTAAVTIQLKDTNDVPIASEDGPYSTVDDLVLTVSASDGVLINDWDPDGDSLEAILYSDATYGTVSLNPDGSFTYAPSSDYVGWDEFLYRPFDGEDFGDPKPVPIARNRFYIVSGEYEREVGGPISYTEVFPGADVWVGELVALEVEVEGPLPPTIASYEWNAEGWYIKDYEVEPDGSRGTVEYHEPEDYTKEFFDLYWYVETPGFQNAVTVGLHLVADDVLEDDRFVELSANFEVKSPLISVLTTIDEVTYEIHRDPLVQEAEYGNGVEISATVVDAPEGSMTWYQLATDWTTRAYFPNDPGPLADPNIGPGEYIRSSYGFVKKEQGDTFEDFQPVTVSEKGVGDGGTVEHESNYSIYLMWKSDRPRSIPAPVRRVDWHFSFSAVAVPDEEVGWAWGEPFYSSANLSGGYIASSYPVWNSLFDPSFDWQPLG